MLSSWLILAACILVGLLNEVSASVLNLSMADVAHDLGATPRMAQHILLVAKLALGALLLAGGGIGDRFGRKRVMLVGIVLVALAAGGSAAARSAGVLMAARLLDGIGNALIGPLALAIAVTTFPETMRARVIGLFLGVSGLGVAIGPLIAGMLVQWGGWRVGFAAPFGLALVGGCAIAALAPSEPPAQRRPPSDVIGMLLCVVGLVGIVLGFVRAGSQGWLDPVALGALGAGVLCLAVFGWWETRRAAVPLLEPALLLSRPALVAQISALLAAVVLNGTVLPLLYFLQRIQGYSPIGAVLSLLPLVAAATVVAPMAGGLAERRGSRGVMAAGFLAVALGSALMTFLTPASPYGLMVVGLVLIGAGSMAVITPSANIIMAMSGARRSGSAAALNSALLQVGGAIGIGVLTSQFMARATGTFWDRMAARGYVREEIAEPARVLRDIVRQTTLDQIPVLPQIPPQLQRDLVEVYAQAFAAGMGRVFLVATVVALVALAIVGLAMGGRRQQVAPKA